MTLGALQKTKAATIKNIRVAMFLPLQQLSELLSIGTDLENIGYTVISLSENADPFVNQFTIKKSFSIELMIVGGSYLLG